MADTFDQFVFGQEGVVAITFPAGQPEELVTTHLMDIKAALIDIISTVDYYKRRCRDTYPYCSSMFSCGATVIEPPRGEIQRVFTLEGNCCPVFYDFVQDYDTFLNWLNGSRKKWTMPANTGLPSLPAPFKFMESSLDKGYRNNWGRYTLHNKRLYVGERIESSEFLVVEWKGVKRNWKPDDILPYDDSEEGDKLDMGVELKRAVSSFLLSEHLRKWERDERGAILERSVYDKLVADLMLADWRERIPKVQHKKAYDQLLVSGSDTCRNAECAAVPVKDSSTPRVFAIIGDWGKTGDDVTAVQALVKSWSPEYIVTTGDNRYGVSFDDLFADLTYYAGVVASGLMFPGVGNHDTDDVDGIAGFLAAFPYLPGDKRNWDIQLGGVHFFFRESHDSGSNIPTAAQLALSAAQLRVRLAASKADWKVVITQDPPYVSDTLNNNGHTASQLDYKGWGADIVISGDSHLAEKLLVDDFPYLVEGGGGATLATPTAPITGSLVRSGTYGALRGTASCDSLILERFDVNGNLIYTQELTH